MVEEGGFLYDSDAYDDELPYLETVRRQAASRRALLADQQRRQVRPGSVGTSDQCFDFAKDAFDMLYAEGATQPKMMSVGLHMRLIGHPARAAGLARFLDYVSSMRTSGSRAGSTSPGTG